MLGPTTKLGEPEDEKLEAAAATLPGAEADSIVLREVVGAEVDVELIEAAAVELIDGATRPESRLELELEELEEPEAAVGGVGNVTHG